MSQLEVCPSLFNPWDVPHPAFRISDQHFAKEGEKSAGGAAGSSQDLLLRVLKCPRFDSSIIKLPLRLRTGFGTSEQRLLQRWVFLYICLYACIDVSLCLHNPKGKPGTLGCCGRRQWGWRRAGEGEATAVLTVTSISCTNAVPKPLWSSCPQARPWRQRPLMGFGTECDREKLSWKPTGKVNLPPVPR